MKVEAVDSPTDLFYESRKVLGGLGSHGLNITLHLDK